MTAFTKEHTMLAQNLWSIPVILVVMACKWSVVGPSLWKVVTDMSLLARVLPLGLVNACGVFFIYNIKDRLGQLNLVKIQTSKQLLTVLQSLLLSDHGTGEVLCLKIVSVLAAIVCVSWEQVVKPIWQEAANSLAKPHQD